ncbi:hypothetical protein ACFQZT_12760 [Paenibacillus sp. GCM10027628]|uniref:hypothetical protein n=1 Tax=Paenibacillus sp. GCM10027628 TaxID=3273413 RepID=UPI00364218BE
MSDVFLKLIPKNPEYIPADTKLLEIKEWIAQSVKSDKTEFILTDEVRFIDQGGNFESVSCPFCASNIEIGWWQRAMDKAYEDSFHNLRIVVDCCGKSTSLNELRYVWNAGFSRFSIEIMNPQDELKDEDFEHIEQVLGSPVSKVIARY